MNAALLSSKKMDYCTPQDFFDRLNEEFHFTLDAAATDKSAKCPAYYTPETDGLKSPWNLAGGAVFCNPPYGREVGKWVRKAYEEAQRGATVVLLIPARTDTTYFHDYIAGVKHYETRPRRTHIRGRVAVHAGRLDEVQATKHLTNGEFWAVLEATGGGGNLPRGAVIGTVEIVDCVPVEELVDSLDNRERLLGDYSPGRFAWVLQNPVMFKTPIPAHGKQGWWNWEEPT